MVSNDVCRACSDAGPTCLLYTILNTPGKSTIQHFNNSTIWKLKRVTIGFKYKLIILYIIFIIYNIIKIFFVDFLHLSKTPIVELLKCWTCVRCVFSWIWLTLFRPCNLTFVYPYGFGWLFSLRTVDYFHWRGWLFS